MDAATSTHPPLRVLVIGAGPMARAVHLPVLAGLRDRGGITLGLICDLQSGRAAAAHALFAFAEYGGDAFAAVTRADIDVVYIFGSAQLHFECGMQALRHGKHLFVEKPIAPSYAQARALALAARDHGVIAAGGHNRRFHRSLGEVRRRGGRSGWRFAEAVFHKPEHGRAAPFGARTWLGANGIHGLDALIFMMGGPPEHLTALTGETSAAIPGAFSALMRWRDGAQGVFLCNNHSGARREEYVFHNPGVTYTVTGEGLTIARDGGETRLALPSMEDGFAAEHESFIAAVRSGADPIHSIAALAPSLRVAELIETGFSGLLPPMDEGVTTAAHATGGARTAGESSVADARAGSSGHCDVGRHCVLVDQAASLQPALARLLPHCRLVCVEDLRHAPELAANIRAAILGRGAEPLPPEVLARLPRLSIVGMVGLSLARHSPDALLARNIIVVNAVAAHADSVAEFALGLAILGRRRASVSHELMRAGGWGTVPATGGVRSMLTGVARRCRPPLRAAGIENLLLRLWRSVAPRSTVAAPCMTEARELRGTRVGLIGWGAAARAFCTRLLQAGAEVTVYSQYASPQDIADSGATPVSLGEALAADIVSVHRGLTGHTRHGLGEAELARLRPGSLLINVARGALIEPSALLARLKRGDIFACLDSFEEEPLPRPHPLRALPNVFLTAHIAGGSRDMQAAAAEEVIDKVAAHLAGGEVQSLSQARLRTMT